MCRSEACHCCGISGGSEDGSWFMNAFSPCQTMISLLTIVTIVPIGLLNAPTLATVIYLTLTQCSVGIYVKEECPETIIVSKFAVECKAELSLSS